VRRPASAALACAALACAAQGAAADAWTLGGSVSARGESVSNPSLAVPAGERALRLTLAADLELRASTEVWEAALSAGVARHRSNESMLDTDDRSLALRLARRFERDTLEVAAAYRRDSTQASELRETGLVLARAQRDHVSLAPTWRRALTERLSAFAGLAYSQSHYPRPAAGLVDNSSESARAGLSYALGPRTDLSLSASATRTDTSPFTTRSRSQSAQVSLSHAWSERLSLSAAYGPSRTRTTVAALARVCALPQVFCDLGLAPFTVFPTTFEQVTRGYVYSLAANWQADPRSTLALAASRSASASGSGFPTETDSVSATWSHRLDEYLSLSADAAFTRADALGGIVAARTRTERYAIGFAWQLAEDWFLDAGARLQRAELPGGGAPRSEAVHFGLRYQLRERPL
jgi:hypothetical protein